MKSAIILFAAAAASAAAAPEAPRSPNHMFYDPARRQIAVLSASNESGIEELWGWDGKRWARLSDSGPPARELSGAAYDTKRRRLVLYGGSAVRPRQGRLDDTWEWDGTRWFRLDAAGPGPRDHHAMAYDEARGRTVLFGGLNADGQPDGDTWEWDGERWIKAATEGPAGGGGAHFGLSYDAIRKSVILFGGMDVRGKSHNQTWAWDGKRWNGLAPEAPVPEARYRHRTVFDANEGVIVLFGGLLPKAAPASVGDTWTWDGKNWREIRCAGGAASPAPRNSHVMAYDPTRRRAVLFGGGSFDGKTSTHFDDLWEWDGRCWTRVN